MTARAILCGEYFRGEKERQGTDPKARREFDEGIKQYVGAPALCSCRLQERYTGYDEQYAGDRKHDPRQRPPIEASNKQDKQNDVRE